MNVKKFALAALAVGVVVNIYDFVVHTQLLAGVYSRMSEFLKPDASIPLLVVADFVAAIVFVWFYDKTRNSFSAGVKGGLTFGLYAGVFLNFPTWLLAQMLIKGFSYELAWTWILVGFVWCLIAGAVAGFIYQRGS